MSLTDLSNFCTLLYWKLLFLIKARMYSGDQHKSYKLKPDNLFSWQFWRKSKKDVQMSWYIYNKNIPRL